jgi:hypothetical protein
MPIVQLGNSEPTGVDVPAVTTVTIPDPDATVADILTSITAVSQGGLTGGVWQAHSTALKPDWVWSNDPEVEEAIAKHYGCARGVPHDVEEKYFTSTPPGVIPQEG